MYNMNFVAGIIGILILSLTLSAQAQESNISVSNTEVIERLIAQQINQYRMETGLNELGYDQGISSIARQHGEDLKRTGLFQHETPGTVMNSVARGALNGYGLCGDIDTIKRFNETNQLIGEFNKRVIQYEKDVQAFIYFYSDNQAESNRLVVEERWLTNMDKKLNEIIPTVQNKIDVGMIGIGFDENLASIQSVRPDDRVEFVDAVVNGWKSSIPHNEVLLNYGHTIGISIVEDNQNQRTLVVLNTC